MPKNRRNLTLHRCIEDSYSYLSDNSSLSSRNHRSWARLAMCIDNSGLRTIDHTVASPDVPLSRWVNERLPAWNEILTARDVARLTRRHRWLLTALTLVGGFPKKHQYRGRSIGWLRTDVDEWLGRRRHVQGPCSKLRSSKSRCRRHADPAPGRVE